MSFIGSMLGQNGTGLNYRAQGADIQSPTTNAQAEQAYQNTQQGLAQQQAFINALQAQGGIGNQSAVFNQQQQLANQLQAMGQGAGPNPAQAQLAQNTGNNIAAQSAMMAGQRGAGANAGLLARQAAQQGGQMQQQATGQAATLQAQQQLAAINALQGQQGMMGNLASQQVGQQGSALSGYNQFAQGQQQNLLNAIAQQNNARIGMQSNMNSNNAGIANTAAQGQIGMVGGGAQGVGAGVKMLMAAHGGEIPAISNGEEIPAHEPKSFAVRFMKGLHKPQANPELSSQLMAHGGEAANMKEGGNVKGKLAVDTDKDTLKNDTVPAALSPGEVVIPRSVMNSEDPVGNAAKFIQAILAKKGK